MRYAGRIMIARTRPLVATACLLLGLAVGLAGCATASPDRVEAACRMTQENRMAIARAGPRDLFALSLATPAEDLARSAYAQSVSTVALGVVGGAALLAGLISGFATDPAKNPAARNAAYGLGGGAMGALGTAWLLSYTTRVTIDKARMRLLDWSQQCR